MTDRLSLEQRIQTAFADLVAAFSSASTAGSAGCSASTRRR